MTEKPGAVLLIREHSRVLRPDLYTIPKTPAERNEELRRSIGEDLRTVADRADDQGARVAVAMSSHSGTRVALGIFGSWPDTDELTHGTRYDEAFARFGESTYSSSFVVDPIDGASPQFEDFLGGGPR